jgi:hypothetical protein
MEVVPMKTALVRDYRERGGTGPRRQFLIIIGGRGT